MLNILFKTNKTEPLPSGVMYFYFLFCFVCKITPTPPPPPPKKRDSENLILCLKLKKKQYFGMKLFNHVTKQAIFFQYI